MSSKHFKEYNDEPVERYYEVHEVLGKGAFSTVYRVVDKETKKEYALKVMDRPPKHDKGKNKIINIEIEILMRLNHPNCVKLFAVFNNVDKISLVIQLITGGELFERIIELQSYSEEAAARLVRQLLEGLAHMHAADVIHRDLKPENLLLSDKTDRARLVLTDFGLSDIMRPAPEILIALDSGIPYGPEVDMFGVGVITYILLSGIPPFYGNDEEEIYQKTETGQYSYMSPYWDNISQDARNFIDALLTLDRNARLTAKQALKHTWLQAGKASTTNMADTLKQLKRYQAKRKFQAAVKGLLAINKLKRLTLSESLLETIESKLRQEAMRDSMTAPFQGPVIFTDESCETAATTVKRILQKQNLAYAEVKMDTADPYRLLLNKLTQPGLQLPQVFLGKEYIGGVEELASLDESGDLAKRAAALHPQVLQENVKKDSLTVEIISGAKLAKKDLFASDPYVLVGVVDDRNDPDFLSNPSASGTSYYMTAVKKNTLNPKWACVPIQITGENLAQKFLRLECWDYDKIGDDDFMGVVHVPIQQLIADNGEERDEMLENRTVQTAPKEKVSGSITFRGQFSAAGSEATAPTPFRRRSALSAKVAQMFIQNMYFSARGANIPRRDKNRTRSKKFASDSRLGDVLTPGSGFTGVVQKEPALTDYFSKSVSKAIVGRGQTSSEASNSPTSLPFIVKVDAPCLNKATEVASMCWTGKYYNPFSNCTRPCMISEQRQKPHWLVEGDYYEGVNAKDIVYLIVIDHDAQSTFQVGLPCLVSSGAVAAPRELVHFRNNDHLLPIRVMTDVVWSEHTLL